MPSALRISSTLVFGLGLICKEVGTLCSVIKGFYPLRSNLSLDEFDKISDFL